MAGHDRETADGKWWKQQIRELKKLEVRVGYQQGRDVSKKGVDLAEIAMWNELGTVNSPPRPFLRQSVDSNASMITAMCKSQLQLLASKKTDARGVLNQLGIMQRGFIQKTIKEGEFEPNAPSTIRKKHSDKPLIASGYMRQFVNYVIVPRGGGGG